MLERNKRSEGKREGRREVGREGGKPLETQRSTMENVFKFLEWGKVFDVWYKTQKL